MKFSIKTSSIYAVRASIVPSRANERYLFTKLVSRAEAHVVEVADDVVEHITSVEASAPHVVRIVLRRRPVVGRKTKVRVVRLRYT